MPIIILACGCVHSYMHAILIPWCWCSHYIDSAVRFQLV